jgi:peptidoglycan/xylan/chitin deacetylase (PgdA/CDA1 family)
LDTVLSLRHLAKLALSYAARYSGINAVLRNGSARRGVLVLCYHGVVSRDHSPNEFLYRNTVSSRQFREQLEFLGRNFDPISVEEIIQHWEKGTALKARPVLVSFDDGYRNNLELAAPLLSHYGFPALFSITTAYIGRTEVLWPDEVNLRVLGWQSSTIPLPHHDDSQEAATVPPTQAGRIRLAESIRAACKALPGESVYRYLDLLRSEPCPTMQARDSEIFDFLSWEEVRALEKAGFDIGSHTVTHRILSQISTEEVESELRESKRIIESETGKKCSCLVYPNGQKADVPPDIAELVGRAGYRLAFTLTGSHASFQGNRFLLSRINVPGHQPRVAFESHAGGLYSWIKSAR